MNFYFYCVCVTFREKDPRHVEFYDDVESCEEILKFKDFCKL